MGPGCEATRKRSVPTLCPSIARVLATPLVYSKHNYATSLCKALMHARMICIFVQKLTSMATCPKNHVLELIVVKGQYVST